MPLATVAITARRKADDAVSKTFGARGCAVHTPSASRPGLIGTTLRDGFMAAGFALGTTSTSAGTASHLLEVYPHPALLALAGAPSRLPYKVSRVRAYRRSIGATIDDG
jgi:predicted RNase H-like nuclease